MVTRERALGLLRFVVVVGCLAIAGVLTGTATADPSNSPQNFPLHAVCTGLGPVQLNQLGPSHTNAFHVDGTNTIIVGAANGAPGLMQRALAAGTTCTFGFGTVPVVIVNG